MRDADTAQFHHDLSCTVLLVYSLPFKGKGTLEAEQMARVGMRSTAICPTPIPTFPLKEKESASAALGIF